MAMLTATPAGPRSSAAWDEPLPSCLPTNWLQGLLGPLFTFSSDPRLLIRYAARLKELEEDWRTQKNRCIRILKESRKDRSW
jgi:hypothetical protein